jgi:hypothetical protein
MRKFRWESPARRIPRHPYRDSAVVYAILAGVYIGLTALTDGNVRNSLIIGAALFVAATAYAWWRWHERIKRRGVEE